MNTSADLAKIIIEIIDEEKDTDLSEVAKELQKNAESKSQDNKINVTSAVELEQKEKDKIRQIFSNKKSNNHQINFSLDKKIIGGLKIEWGDFILDLSIKEKINQLKQSL